MVEVSTSTTLQFYDHLLQSMTEGFLVVDRNGVVTSANESAATILGYEPEALIGAHYLAFWPETLPSPFEFDSSEVHYHQGKLYHQNGRTVSATISVDSLSAEIAGNLLISITDLTNVERLNSALSHTQKLAGIGTLTASVAHELNTPISIITATCSNLLHEIDGDNLSREQLMHYIEMIEQSAWRCARIVGVLRNYSVNDTLQMAVTDLNMIIEDAVTLVRHQFHGDFNVDVEVDLQDDLKSIVCDHNRLTQVLINLLTNARDAMDPNGGIIEIKSWIIPANSTLSEASPANGSSQEEQFAFSVRDSGHGIAPGIIDKIFEPFFTTKPNGKGTGLGLFIARRIVNQHRGYIKAENNPDYGSTFTVVLPRRQPHEEKEPLSSSFSD